MCAASFLVALFYRWVWDQASHRGLGGSELTIVGVLFLGAPFWIAMQLGISAVGTLSGTLAARALAGRSPP